MLTKSILTHNLSLYHFIFFWFDINNSMSTKDKRQLPIFIETSRFMFCTVFLLYVSYIIFALSYSLIYVNIKRKLGIIENNDNIDTINNKYKNKVLLEYAFFILNSLIFIFVYYKLYKRYQLLSYSRAYKISAIIVCFLSIILCIGNLIHQIKSLNREKQFYINEFRRRQQERIEEERRRQQELEERPFRDNARQLLNFINNRTFNLDFNDIVYYRNREIYRVNRLYQLNFNPYVSDVEKAFNIADIDALRTNDIKNIAREIELGNTDLEESINNLTQDDVMYNLIDRINQERVRIRPRIQAENDRIRQLTSFKVLKFLVEQVGEWNIRNNIRNEFVKLIDYVSDQDIRDVIIRDTLLTDSATEAGARIADPHNQ